MKRYLVLAGMILLAGVIYFHEEKPPAGAGTSRLSAPELTYAKMAVPPVATNSHFLDNINITYDPMVIIPPPQTESLAAGKGLLPAEPEQLQPRPDDTKAPVVTVSGRKVNYELINSEGFSLKFNLTPAYPNPETLIPTRLDPGVGVSIKF